MRFQVLVALASLSLAASVAAAPSAKVQVGFNGLVRPGSPLHLRVELSNPGPAWSGTFRLEETLRDRTSVAWEWPLEVPAQGRRVRFLTLAPAVLGLAGQSGLRAGLVGEGELKELSFRFIRRGQGAFVALHLTDGGTGFSAVRDALDPPGPKQGSIEVQLPAVPPEQVPPTVAAWEAIDAIVIDVGVADRIDAPTWKAIRVRVAQGVTLVVHGLGRLPELFPPEMRPGRPAAGPSPRRWTEPGPDVEHSAMPLELVEGATRPVFDQEFLPWAASRRFGAGRVTVAAIALRNLHSPTSRQAILWAELLGLPALGRADAIRPVAPAPVAVQSDPMSQRSHGTGWFVLLLSACALVCAGALATVRRQRQSETLMRWAPLVGVLAALPLFGAGAVSRFIEDRRPLLIEEHVAALGLTRTTTILSPASARERIGSLPLAGWPPRLLPSGVGASRPMRLELQGGPDPEALGLRPALMPGLSLLTESWSEAEAPFRLETGEGGAVLVRNVSGRDLVEVHALLGHSMLSLGDLPDGATCPLDGPKTSYSGSVAIHALRTAAGRLTGPAIAGIVRTPSAGVLSRPTAAVVVAWLEDSP